MAKCPNCGKIIENLNWEFCTGCGMKFSDYKRFICGKCGSVLSNENAKFCSSCRNEFDEANKPIEWGVKDTYYRMCTHCGKALVFDPEVKFCTVCSQKLDPAPRKEPKLTDEEQKAIEIAKKEKLLREEKERKEKEERERRLAEERRIRAEEKRIRAEERKLKLKRAIRILTAAAAAAVIAVIAIVCIKNVQKSMQKSKLGKDFYEIAKNDYENCSYASAVENAGLAAENCPNMFDAKILLTNAQNSLYEYLKDKYEEGEYIQILEAVNSIDGEYRNDDITKIYNIAAGYIISPAKYYLEYKDQAAKKHTVGLRQDGTVEAAGNNDDGQCSVKSWKDITAVAAGAKHTVGLKKDGTVIAAGAGGDLNAEMNDWKDIIAIAAGDKFTAGLKKDGTVAIAGNNPYVTGEAVESWENIAAISAGYNFIAGLRKDGTVVMAGRTSVQKEAVSEWKDIAAISAGTYHIVGLKKDGTVIAAGNNESGQCSVENWKDIIAISAGDSVTLGLKKDGTVLAAANIARAIDAEYFFDVEKDLTDCTKYYLNINGYDLAVEEGSDGWYVSGWSDIAAISAGYDYILGVKKDGTVVTAGNDANGQLADIRFWQLQSIEEN